MSTQPAPKPKPMYQDLSDFYDAEDFQDRAAFEARTGEKCPPWNPKRRPQNWRKQGMPGSGMEGPDGRELATYQALDPASVTTDAPRLKQCSIAREDAETVNIAPSGPGMTNVPGAGAPEVPIPVKLNPATQILVNRRASGGLPGPLPLVRNLDVSAPISLTPGENLIVSYLERLVVKTGA